MLAIRIFDTYKCIFLTLSDVIMSKRQSRTSHFRTSKYNLLSPKKANQKSIFIKDSKTLSNQEKYINNLKNYFHQLTKTDEELNENSKIKLLQNIDSKKLTDRFLYNINFYIFECKKNQKRISINNYISLGYYVLNLNTKNNAENKKLGEKQEKENRIEFLLAFFDEAATSEHKGYLDQLILAIIKGL